MNRMTVKWAAAMLTLSVLAGETARADLLPKIVRSMELLGFQFSGEHNLLGNGLTVNADGVYQTRRFNLGPIDVTLNGVVRNSVGYTMRFLPEAEYGVSTFGNPLTYTVKINTGLRDITVRGSAIINVATDINALGFYDQVFYISNRGTYEVDGLFGPDDSGPIDYDIGPIDRSGHLGADALGLLTKPLIPAAINPFVKFSNRAARVMATTASTDDLRARVEAGAVLSDEEITALVDCSPLGGMPAGEQADSLQWSAELTDGRASAPQVLGGSESLPVPEPTALSLLALAMLGLRRRRG